MRYRFSFLLMIAVTLTVLPNLAQSDITFEEHILRHDGHARRYLVYVPPQAVDNNQALPLILVLHGGGGNPDIYEEVTGFAEIAHEEGFILVYPGGSGRLRRLLTWNAGHCCGYALEENVDEIGFFRDLLVELQSDYNIDPERIYAAGHSNGGMMTYYLASEMSDVFAAVAVVAGTIGGYVSPDSDELIRIPEPQNPVSVLHIHGRQDNNVSYAGGINTDGVAPERIDLSVEESINFWVDANRCETEPEREEHDEGMVIVETYACPDTQTTVELISIVDSGHAWPGGNAVRRNADPNNQRINAAAEIWNFFENHSRAN